MKSIEDFLKNRISFTVWDKTPHDTNHHSFRVKDYHYEGKIYNPQSLNITNSFDLAEKLMPLICYIVSDTHTQKKK